MPGVARGISSSRYSSPPPPPSHLKLMGNRISSLGLLRVTSDSGHRRTEEYSVLFSYDFEIYDKKNKSPPKK